MLKGDTHAIFKGVISNDLRVTVSDLKKYSTSARSTAVAVKTRSPASAGIANRPLVFLGFFLIFGRLSIY